MTDKEYVREVDHLALGLTKAPMFLGINIKLFFISSAICTLLCINTKSLLGIGVFCIFYVLAAKASLKDPNFIFIWFKSMKKTPPLLNNKYWGGTNSYSPW